MTDFPVRPPAYPLAELLAMKNGPVKKFYLLKQYGPALAAKATLSLLKLREYGCDDLVKFLCGAINHFGEGGHPVATPENLAYFAETYLKACLLPAKGARVRLAVPVDRFPHFIAPAGTAGTVTESSAHTFAVRMDEVIEGAEDWDNEVCWALDHDGQDDPLSEIVAE